MGTSDQIPLDLEAQAHVEQPSVRRRAQLQIVGLGIEHGLTKSEMKQILEALDLCRTPMTTPSRGFKMNSARRRGPLKQAPTV